MLETIQNSWKTTTDNTKERRRFSLLIVQITANKEQGKRKQSIVKIEPGTKNIENILIEPQEKVRKVPVKLEPIN